MRDNVVHAVMSELSLEGSNEEGAMMDLVDEFHTRHDSSAGAHRFSC